MYDRQRSTRSQIRATRAYAVPRSPAHATQHGRAGLTFETEAPAGADLLLTDAERDAAESVLRRALSEGSLTVEEAEGRLERTLAARRRSELVGPLADLPQARAWREPNRAHAGHPWRSPRLPLLLGLALIGVLVIIASAVTGQRPWPLAPLAFFAIRAFWWQRGWRSSPASTLTR